MQQDPARPAVEERANMEVIVDGEKNFSFDGTPDNMVEAVAAIVTYLQEQGRAMMAIEVDGKAVPSTALQETLEDMDTASVQIINVHSESLSALVDQTLSELEEYLPELPNACHSLAEVFHGEHPEEGFEPLSQIISIWSEVKQRQMQVANAIQLDLREITLQDASLEKRHDELNTFLKECADALEKGDCVLLGDLMEYELAPRAEQELEISGLLKERASAHFA